MKKNIFWLIIIVLVLLIIFGILHGWFRKKSSLSQEELNEINRINSTPTPTILPSTNPTETFSQLWFAHVSRTREFILASLHNLPDIQEKENTLLQNQKDIANEIDRYYHNSAPLLTDLLTEHILIAKDIVGDLKYKRLARVPADINRWYDNGDQISEVMQRINPNWNLKSHFRNHLALTELEAIYEWIGLKKASLNIYNNKIVPQAQEMANHISNF